MCGPRFGRNERLASYLGDIRRRRASQMRIAMACDHAGRPLKEEIKALLNASGHEVLDFVFAAVCQDPFCAGLARGEQRSMHRRQDHRLGDRA
jgi:hypothetical protein